MALGQGPACFFFRGWILLSLVLGRKQALQLDSHGCESEKNYVHAGRCCVKCGPGNYMRAKCNATSNTTCLPCGPDQYMNMWNEEDKCLRQKLCDPGKGLVVVNQGNSTFQRECACKPGYHWIGDFEYCTRNTECGPGFEAEIPSHNDRDTICKECLAEHFSSNSSATEKCKPWTNCSALGMVEKVPGTTKTDAICEKSDYELSKVLQFVIFSLLFVSVTLVVVAIFVVYHRKKVKAVTDLQNWVNEACSSIRRAKEKSACSTINNARMNTFCRQHSEGVFLLTLDEKSFSEGMCCLNGQSACGKGCLDARHCHFEGDTLMLSSESEDDQLRLGPTEDEYVYSGLQRASYLAASGPPENKPVAPFSKPLEVEEDHSLSQCFTGTESMPDAGDHCDSEFLCGTDCTQASSHSSSSLRSYHCTCKDPSEDAQSRATCATQLNLDHLNSSHACEMSRRESHRKWRKPLASRAPLSEENFPQCSCSLDFPPTGHISLESGTDESASFDSTDTKHQSTNESTSEASGIASSCTSDLPSPTGNVTGNSNSTFISSGQVMNFKGDIIVVYVSQNSQEAPVASGTSGNVGSPVQEQNQSRCDSFVANTQQQNAKCSDAHQACAAEEEAQSDAAKCERSLGTVVQEETQDCQHPGPCHPNAASVPVQEEGKSEHLSKEAWK
ncbi:tumor necrosis factor receptor superfamily member 11A isoform X2 [Rhinatrema bivittatum]|uniref:tumor necrosis factor receptor superfamily member 11A isoform X2 n=1 Tax=Rhinatrema bivittatum TaxID=194408 RepID=UPI00112C5236|nr:tumor necrosis factor receptor superfamily member 11A isoform X2 [Rhinatrema bivittatum]